MSIALGGKDRVRMNKSMAMCAPARECANSGGYASVTVAQKGGPVWVEEAVYVSLGRVQEGSANVRPGTVSEKGANMGPGTVVWGCISKNQHFLFHLIQSYYILFLLFWG